MRQGGTSSAELAGRTGLSVSQVEREVARAIAQIERCLERRETVPPRVGDCTSGAARCAPERRASPATAGEAVRTGLAPLG